MYRATYDTDGSLQYAYQKQDSSPSILPDRTKQYYDFQGWYTGQNGTGTYIGTGNDPFTFTTDMVLYAYFLGKPYRVEYRITQSGTTPSSVNTINPQGGTITRRYPFKAPLPLVAKEHYDYEGWDDITDPNNVIHYTANDTETTLNITRDTVLLLAMMDASQYITIFKDADGELMERYINQYDPELELDIPENDHADSMAFVFKGWFEEGSQSITPDLGTDATVYTPESSKTFIRKYDYERTLTSNQDTAWAGMTIRGTIFPGITNINALPTRDGQLSRPTKWGYRLSGWDSVSNPPSLSTNPTPVYTDQYVPKYKLTPEEISQGQISDDDRFKYSTNMYPTWQPAELESISLISNVTITKLPSERQKQMVFSRDAGYITTVPEDYLGTFTWHTDDNGTYLSISSNGDQSALITARNSTADTEVKIWATAPKRTWDTPYQTITSTETIVNISDFLQILFYTLNDNDQRVQYSETVGGFTQTAWFVKRESTPSGPVYTWVNPYEQGSTYPQGTPSRADFIFINWLDYKGNLVDETHPPKTPASCDASWMSTYLIEPKDKLILQKYNLDDTGIISQMDMGLVSSLREVFQFNLMPTATPTMSSENTFITDMSIKETIPVEFVRKNPEIINDNQTDSKKWSNAKWIAEVRKLVDRWQSETDGIKVLFLPKGLKVVTVNGEDVAFGDNYDMLGYVKKKTETKGGQTIKNYGISYDANRVLMGYNAVITSYSDEYVAGNNNILKVSMTFSLGGMKSQYQDWIDGLLLK